MMKNVILKWILDRLSERTTWIGLTAILTSTGAVISPELQGAIISTGISVAGLIAIITKE